MKKTLSMLAIMSAVLVSCTKSEINEDNGNSSNEEENPSEEMYLNVYYDDIVFPSNGGEDYFDIESNTDWTISNTSDWLTIKPTEGNGNASITLTATASDDYDDRNTVITVKAGDKTETFTITQKYAEALLVTKNKFDIPTQKPCLSQKTNSIFHKRVETLPLKFKVIYHTRFRLIQTVNLGFQKLLSQKH